MTLLLAVAIVTFYSGLLIKRCMDFDSSIATYPDIGSRAFGKGGRTVVSVFMYVELYMVATGFLILEGDNLHDLFPGVRLEFEGFSLDGEACFVLIAALVSLPSVLIDNMSLLSYVSATGVIASFVILGSIIWTGASDQSIGFNQKGSLLNWSGIPSAISLYAFCYCAHPVFPTLYTSMKNKSHFSNVSNNLLIFPLSMFFIFIYLRGLGMKEILLRRSKNINNVITFQHDYFLYFLKKNII